VIEGTIPAVGPHQDAKALARARRPYLDGLRAVAVYLVLAYHSPLTQATGGFVGVDVFFVLSGYLVTQVLTRDISGQGSIGFARFYARRFRRLLPAATVMLIVSGVTYSMMASPLEITGAVAGFKAAFLYVMNWYVIHQALDHAHVVAYGNPAFLFWSLAVEEQFYLVWPFLLGGLFALTRRSSRQRSIIRAIIIAGALASLAWALGAPNAAYAYYRTDARAYELLAGALLALTPRVAIRLARSATAANVLSLVSFGALGLIASPVIQLDPAHRTVLATVIAALLILSIEAAPSGLIARLLSTGPVVYLGLVSYGTYLWQWPVILIMRRVAFPNPWQTAFITGLVATGIASLSYQMLERPIRESRMLDRVPRVTVVTGLAISVICALVIVPIALRVRTH
jgi:peptidoglycan/LPS O-acetylase OafA/YrhL